MLVDEIRAGLLVMDAMHGPRHRFEFSYGAKKIGVTAIRSVGAYAIRIEREWDYTLTDKTITASRFLELLECPGGLIKISAPDRMNSIDEVRFNAEDMAVARGEHVRVRQGRTELCHFEWLELREIVYRTKNTDDDPTAKIVFPKDEELEEEIRRLVKT